MSSLPALQELYIWKWPLDTDSFLNAIRRFIARRGQVVELYSDNGTNLVGVERELIRAVEGSNHAQINNTLIQKGIKWIFNPLSGSPHGVSVGKLNKISMESAKFHSKGSKFR